MSDKPERDEGQAAGGPAAIREELLQGAPFGAAFFLTRLRAFVRERCPDPAEGLPVVELHLADGEVLDLCHVIGVAQGWVALAVNEIERPAAAPRMRTEIVPYECIVRVTVRSARVEAAHVGFDPTRVPPVLAAAQGQESTPESALAHAGGGRVVRTRKRGPS